jgi:hypothetical protein
MTNIADGQSRRERRSASTRCVGCLDGNARDKTPFAMVGRRKANRHAPTIKISLMKKTGMHNENGGKA